MKAHYFVLGYDRSTSPELKLKIEPYLQKLYEVPVVEIIFYRNINNSICIRTTYNGGLEKHLKIN
ncbi:MAG TPA: hypothetical protein ENH59_10880 [Bacteroidetes bacterium]|nr:hypothetical protein [Bacteroidota bacterium]